jgi:hypothetical protein
VQNVQHAATIFTEETDGEARASERIRHAIERDREVAHQVSHRANTSRAVTHLDTEAPEHPGCAVAPSLRGVKVTAKLPQRTPHAIDTDARLQRRIAELLQFGRCHAEIARGVAEFFGLRSELVGELECLAKCYRGGSEDGCGR